MAVHENEKIFCLAKPILVVSFDLLDLDNLMTVASGDYAYFVSLNRYSPLYFSVRWDWLFP